MSCEKADGLIPVRYHPQGNPIAWLNRHRRLLAIPVRWSPHFLYKCEAWTFDLRTWRHYRPSFDLVHVHLVVNEVSIIYRIAAGTFETAGHSSHSCTDREGKHAEKLHCPKDHFDFDRELEALYPASPYAQQMALPLSL